MSSEQAPASSPAWTTLSKAFVLAMATFFFAITLIDFAAGATAQIPSQDPNFRVNSHGAEVYADIFTPYRDVTAADIAKIDLQPDAAFGTSAPFTQLWAASRHPFALVIGVGVAALALAALVTLVVTARRSARSRASEVLALASGAAVIAYGHFFIASRIAKATWDEVFVFASQARNFSESGLAAVPITGPRGLAESSADALYTILGGLLLRLAPALDAESALVIGASLASAGLFIVIACILRYALKRSIWISLAAPLVLVMTPQGLLALGVGMPTALGIAGLTTLALVSYVAFARDQPVWLAAAAVPLALVRWEYGFLLILASLYLVIAHRIAVKRGTADPWSRRAVAALLVPLAFVLVSTGARVVLFGSFAPSGALGKSIGFDGAAFSNGFAYLTTTNVDNLWILLLIVATIGVVFVGDRAGQSAYVASTVLAGLPIVSAILVGGDWFPTEWARYIAPSVSAIVLLSIVEATRDSTPGTSTSAPVRRRFAWALLFGFTVAQTGLAAMVFSDTVRSTGPQDRTTCLALAGQTLARVIPPEEGLATPEVNTLAYFAGAPVTDLIGIIDPRIASAPPSPLSAGDILHRRADHTLIQADKPGAIYYFEGAVCTSPQVSPSDDAAEWESLLNALASRYRVGDPNLLLESYTPTSIHVGDDFTFRFLLRTDLLEKVASTRD